MVIERLMFVWRKLCPRLCQDVGVDMSTSSMAVSC